MNDLDPQTSALLAKDVYALTDFNTLEKAFVFLKSRYGDVFRYSENDLLQGVSGGFGPLKCRTAFGFSVVGKGPLKGNAFIIFRGTSYLADVLTDLNCSVSSSSTGKPLHDGFNKSFKSMESQLAKFMTSKAMNGIHTVHCIGHSLGGALATICGDWIQSTYKRKPYIYSFGCPRVGLYTFASTCTNRIGSERIFRAYHKTDIVPCIPPWPFSHTPISGVDYFLPSPGIIPIGEYHRMKHYVESVSGRSWKSLSSLRDIVRDDNGIASWLKDKSFVGLTISSIEWLNQALIFVLKKCFDGVAWLISETFSSTFTLMDQLAYILNKGIDLANAVSDWVLYLIKKILQVIGMNDDIEMAELSVQFIRMVLQNLQLRVNRYAKDALSKTMVDGRAI